MKIGSAQVTCESLTWDTKSVYILSGLLTGVHNKRVSFRKKISVFHQDKQTVCYIWVSVLRGGP